MGPLQFFMNCSSIGPFHGVKSFINRLSLFPNEVTSSARKPALVWACHRITALFQASICSGKKPSMSAGESQFWHLELLLLLPLLSAELFLSHMLTSPSWAAIAVAQGVFFHFKNILSQRHLLPLLMGLTLDRSGSIGHRKSWRSHHSQ